jgi:hypothetical protein
MLLTIVNHINNNSTVVNNCGFAESILVFSMGKSSPEEKVQLVYFDGPFKP